MVRKSRHPSRDEAIDLLGRLGNQVLDGAKLAAVARAGSEGSTAREGGLHDWTNKGNLVSESLDNAIFSLPVGQLSRIIETDLGYHVVRVVQRQDQSLTPFLEAQVDIRNKLVRQRKKSRWTTTWPSSTSERASGPSSMRSWPSSRRPRPRRVRTIRAIDVRRAGDVDRRGRGPSRRGGC